MHYMYLSIINDTDDGRSSYVVYLIRIIYSYLNQYVKSRWFKLGLHCMCINVFIMCAYCVCTNLYVKH